MNRFENGQRIIVSHPEHPCFGKAGSVVRLRRIDSAAFGNMDDPLPEDLASFPEGDTRRNHMMFYPDECEPEAPNPLAELTSDELFLDALREMRAPKLLPPPETARPEPAVPLHLKLWLTLEEAAVYSGISRARLREMM